MRTLHLVPSEVDPTTRRLVTQAQRRPGNEVFVLGPADVDYDLLIESIFAAGRVVGWWIGDARHVHDSPVAPGS